MINILTTDSPEFKEFTSMYKDVCEKHAAALNENIKLSKEVWLSTKDAAAYVGLHPNTLTKYMEEIGYSRPTGADVRFKIADLDGWMNKSYRQVRPNFKLRTIHK